MRAYQRLEKSYVATDLDKNELGRYTTVDGLKRAMNRRGLERKEYRIFQLRFRN